ncbi:hypothetical protein G7B40_000210 [Aetokthonos hydrillicola Thurmond2011]|uniref:Uncharacterized protein n=1 Tax=Aetokthonos hydrillicola Thurmond2011 TaxID=2712845 RepID=A0AAP5I4K1_9CYAN|nr:hypothetical protein [Aetokthonos hydrillicola]MBO3460152.1 hypothetical protein [Aetokthonos hydrillicola CCALA 1050]MBW4590479.1 hypothetical protein [Aetokthonos hydrillicola CCALA 1050]MDR9893008.1 hypothetical protein [Aetokthonos hydrillicola Thurmond2011]
MLKEDHKYDGKLAVIQIEIYKDISLNTIYLELSISFGSLNNQVKRINIWSFKEETINIKFGIKSGELCLNLTNGSMPLCERKELLNQYDNWRGIPVGKPEAPVWQFELHNQSSIKDILKGSLRQKILGNLKILEADTCCEIEAVFKISLNKDVLAIISPDISKVRKETLKGALVQRLKPELENYVSKVTLRYEPAINF